MRTLLIVGAWFALVAGTAQAAPNVASTSQKGSLLIFADIDVRDSKTTFVRLVNDGDSDAKVKCLYVDPGGTGQADPGTISYKNFTDFVIRLTPRQPVWFDAKTGNGSNGLGTANRFPPQIGMGELICFAVTVSENSKRKFNHLAGTASVMDFASSTAYEYNAHAFYARELAPPLTTLRLDGLEYDVCPSYLIGQFTPAGGALVSPIGLGPAGLTAATEKNRLTVASCVQVTGQDNVPVFTKLEFEVWNANEVKFTGSYRCSDSWWETLLDQDQLMYNPQNFRVEQLGTTSAYYRVKGVASVRCTGSVGIGLVGVQSSIITMFGPNLPRGVSGTGTALSQAGTFVGSISFEAGSETEEGRVR